MTTAISNFSKDAKNEHTTVTVTIATAARYNAGTALPAGLVLGKITASGKYAEYNDGAADGTETAAGILCDNIDVADGDVAAAMFFHGTVDKQHLYGLDTNGETDLAAKIMIVDDTP